MKALRIFTLAVLSMMFAASTIADETGPLAPNPAWNGKTESNTDMTYILFAAIVLAVIVLAFALVTALRRLPKSDDEGA
ncbi:MAG: hypothetical protein FWF96_00310 [Kiritimatiellaeota bacterium]|nr:hypothetical protein [Kiritimatiellota bacterium]